MSSNWRLEGRRLLVSVPSAVSWVYCSPSKGSGGALFFQEPANNSCRSAKTRMPTPNGPSP